MFEGLNDDQAAAVAAVTGPVCILAGAGSGKTATITRRIANQVMTGVFSAREILAVTFTEKAAKQMASRLERLGIRGVRARTFHAEALSQDRRFREDSCEIVASKAQIIAALVGGLPVPYRFTALRDVAAEIEWAKNRRLRPDQYRVEAVDRTPPIPVDLMAGIFAAYERRKARAGLIDFEDLLERTIDLLQGNSSALDAVRSRYRAFTVDEYQDVNLLQQTLLDSWVGERNDLCVVGDDHQSIFGFTGASPRYLLDFPARYPGCAVVRLTQNYRSTPQVLEVANRLLPSMGGSPKTLRPMCRPGPDPLFQELATGDLETGWVVEQALKLQRQGVAWEDVAVLYRINGRSEELGEALSAARIPYQVRDSAFLRRPATRAVIHRLRSGGDDVAAAVEAAVRHLGYQPDREWQGEEATRQADLRRLLNLAQNYAGGYPGGGGVAGFIADLQQRFTPEEEGRGVQILTYHRAKGLEFEAVFLPRFEDRELPFVLTKSPDALAEERRLLYVGITRAKRFLFVSWAMSREGERRRRRAPSPFLADIRPLPLRASVLTASQGVSARGTERGGVILLPPEHRELFDALRSWRLEEARNRGVSAFVVFADSTLRQIAQRRPRTLDDLPTISGIGPAKVARYGQAVLAIVGSCSDPGTQ